MLDEKVRNVVLSILSKERDRASVDWAAIEAAADAAIAYIVENGVEIDNTINHFLEDTDVRRKSEAYARHQTSDVLKALEI